MTFGIRQADKYALALLDALFSDDKLACSCYAMTKRSKKPNAARNHLYQLIKWPYT